MSLADSIINKTVGSAMGSNRSLANMNSTTLSKAGTSLSQINREVSTSVAQSTNPAQAQAGMTDPITKMMNYASEQLPGSFGAIRNAANDAINYMDSRFKEGLPGLSNTLYDIQNAAGEAISSGVDKFTNALSGISSTVGQTASTVGNAAMSGARQVADLFSSNANNAATQGVNNQVANVNSALASEVEAQNAEAQAQGAAAAGDAVSTGTGDTLDAVTVEGDAVVTRGIWAGNEGEGRAGINTTDIVYQDIKVYIEGVQVPFEAISISQNIGEYPSAIVQVPPQSGLMDIARYYQPKVHIFYTDRDLGGDRLLFWGHIIACNYAKSRQQGMATISFRCHHKNALFEQVTLEWSNYVNNVISGGGDPNANVAAAQVSALNSKQSLISALKGLSGLQESEADSIVENNPNVMNADVTKLDQKWADFENRLIGMPAAAMNLWNQLKQTCYANPGVNTIMSKIYIPLVEDGLGFFDRLAGHYHLEKIIQDSKEPYCGEKNTPQEKGNLTMVPPAFKLPSMTAISQTLAIQALQNQLNFSGEMATFPQLFRDFYLTVEYEMITLASPASVPVDPNVTVNPDDPASSSMVDMMAIETIIKPQIPFYFSPLCNVLLPKMYHTISIDQDEDVVPSRITAYHDTLALTVSQIGSNYRSPNSIREAIAIGIGLAAAQGASNGAGVASTEMNLRNTTGPSYNIPGKYEQGRGVRHRKIAMPSWLALLVMGRSTEGGTLEVWPEKGSQEYNDMMDLYAAWVDRYGYDIIMNDDTIQRIRNESKDALNPYAPQAQIQPFERLLFATADYDFTKQVAQSRNGMVECLFNPFIVPGYPMDIIDESPNHPSWHALCASVTHNISARSIGTTVGVVGAMSYAELSNYFLNPLHPWLQTSLDMINVDWESNQTVEEQSVSGQSGETGGTPDQTDPLMESVAGQTGETGGSPDNTTTSPPAGPNDEYADVSSASKVRQSLIGNPRAKQTADKFYLSTFGVGAAAPDDIYDFAMGQPIPIRRTSGAWGPGTSSHLAMTNGGEGNDFLTGVGNLRLVSRPIEGKKAIEAKFGIKFIDLTPQNYAAAGSVYQNPILGSDILLEPGASMFLDYQETREFVGAALAEKNTPMADNSQTGETGGTPEQ